MRLFTKQPIASSTSTASCTHIHLPSWKYPKKNQMKIPTKEEYPIYNCDAACASSAFAVDHAHERVWPTLRLQATEPSWAGSVPQCQPRVPAARPGHHRHAPGHGHGPEEAEGKAAQAVTARVVASFRKTFVGSSHLPNWTQTKNNFGVGILRVVGRYKLYPYG